jgi:heptosyltransferase-2
LPAPSPHSRILAICPIGIGNFLLLAPALSHLKTACPDAVLDLLALKPEIAALAARFPFIRQIHSIRAKRKSGILELRPLFRQYDLSMAFFPSNRLEYNLLPFLVRVRKRTAFRYHAFRMATGSFLNSTLVPVSEDRHDLEQNFRLLEVLGIPPSPGYKMLPFPLTADEKDRAEDFIREQGLENARLIGIHPGSSADHGMDKKRWPMASFADLAGLMARDRPSKFLVFGGPDEQALKDNLAAALGDKVLVINTASLFDTAALIGRCAAFISNDSGLMHIAVAQNVRTCGIFGPTDDRRTAPYGKGHLVVRKKLDCCPCWTIRNVGRRESCRLGDFRCLGGLTAGEVYKKIKSWLA